MSPAFPGNYMPGLSVFICLVFRMISQQFFTTGKSGNITRFFTDWAVRLLNTNSCEIWIMSCEIALKFDNLVVLIPMQSQISKLYYSVNTQSRGSQDLLGDRSPMRYRNGLQTCGYTVKSYIHFFLIQSHASSLFASITTSKYTEWLFVKLRNSVQVKFCYRFSIFPK